MLTHEDNQLLTEVGEGTPGGALMRRYWHPVAAAVQLDGNPVQGVRILGENLVLFRDLSGNLGLIDQHCPHRLMDLRFGIPENEGIRCPYHGWMFDTAGTCIETPLEPPGSTFKNKIQTRAYPVQELGGLVWAYLGPEPAPLLPHWDLLVKEGGFRQIVGHQLPCNWLQVMENRGDLGHAIYLHGKFFQYVLSKEGKLTDDPNARYNSAAANQENRLARGAYPLYEPRYNQFGMTKANRDSDKSEETATWRVGTNPILFPYQLAFGPGRRTIRQTYQFGVPIDDTHTWHIQYFCYMFPPEVGVPAQDHVPYAEVPLKNDQGEYVLNNVLSQDMVAWYGQGEITDRTREHLAVSDACVIAYRQMLRDQIKIVRDGGEPINVFRDQSSIDRPELVLEPPEDDRVTLANVAAQKELVYRSNFHQKSKGGWLYLDDDIDRYCPDRDTVVELYRRADEMGIADVRRSF